METELETICKLLNAKFPDPSNEDFSFIESLVETLRRDLIVDHVNDHWEVY